MTSIVYRLAQETVTSVHSEVKYVSIGIGTSVDIRLGVMWCAERWCGNARAGGRRVAPREPTQINNDV